MRAKIEVDPHHRAADGHDRTAAADRRGRPDRSATIDAVIDRPGFIFNPTELRPDRFAGTAYEHRRHERPDLEPLPDGLLPGADVQAELQSLAPGKTSRANGASLTAKIVYPAGALGANQASCQSNIASVKVELPKRLPSRLTTLQKACTAAQFEANPAGCPAASIVGHATALTPVLPVPLTRPGVLRLPRRRSVPEPDRRAAGLRRHRRPRRGHVHRKKGITSSTFGRSPTCRSASFELNLPRALLGARGQRQPLQGQAADADRIRRAERRRNQQNTPIAVTGCPKAKKGKKAKAKGGSKSKGARVRGGKKK